MDLLEVLKLYKKETDKIEEQERKVPAHPPQLAGFWFRIIVSVFLSPIISSIILTIINPDDAMGWVGGDYGGLGLLGTFTIPAAIIYLFWTIKVNKKKKEFQKRKQIEEAKLEKITLECENKMKSIGVVPEHYHYGSAINSFIRYIESLRASTLQECIKLYHEDLKHQESIDTMERMNDNLLDIENRLSDIETEVNYTNYQIRH